MRTAPLAVVLLALAGAPLAHAQTPPAPPPPDPHAGHQMPAPAPADPHAGHARPAPEGAPPPPAAPLPDTIPPITEADRAAAFPDVMGHAVHDQAVHTFVLFDQLEGQGGIGPRALDWDMRGWVGTDLTRGWFRSEGEGRDGRVHEAQLHAFIGRKVSRWWDLLAGVRQDLRPGRAQTWAAVGVQGLAPYWFDVAVTAYLGAAGRTHVRVETEYDLLVTNRLIVQPLVEAEVYGKADPDHGAGAGLSTVDAGVRLRYEIRRRVAPYLGVTWHRAFFGTADRATAAGLRPGHTRLALGLRLWW
jgi:copper resistance protein B